MEGFVRKLLPRRRGRVCMGVRKHASLLTCCSRRKTVVTLFTKAMKSSRYPTCEAYEAGKWKTTERLRHRHGVYHR